jgi:hypothetical protein
VIARLDMDVFGHTSDVIDPTARQLQKATAHELIAVKSQALVYSQLFKA